MRMKVALVVVVAVLCHARAIGAASAGTSARHASVYGDDTTECATCQWIGLYEMVNTTFMALELIAHNTSDNIDRVRTEINEARRKATIMNYNLDEKRVEEAEASTSYAEHQVLELFTVVSLSKTAINMKLLVDYSVFKGNTKVTEEEIGRLLSNFSDCGKCGVKIEPLHVVRGKIEANKTNLTAWKDKTKQHWKKSSDEVWNAIKKADKTKTKPHSAWNRLWDRLNKHLDNVVVPLVQGLADLTVAEKNTAVVQKETALEVEKFVENYTRQHSVLCNASRQLSAFQSMAAAWSGQAVKSATDIESYSKKMEWNNQTMEKYRSVFKYVLPRANSATANEIFSNRAGSVDAHLEKATVVTKEAIVDADAVRKIIDEMNVTALATVGPLRARLVAIREDIKNVTGEKDQEISSDCSGHDGGPTTGPLDAVVTEITGDAKDRYKDHDVIKNITSLSKQWRAVQEILDNITRKEDTVKNAIGEAEKEREDTKNKLEVELANRRRELCMVRKHIEEEKPFDADLEAELKKAQAVASNTLREQDRVQKAMEKVRRDVDALGKVSERVEAAVAEAVRARDTAAAQAAGKDVDAGTDAAAAHNAAAKAGSEGERVVEMRRLVEESEESAAAALAHVEAAASAARGGAAAAAKAKDNITDTLQRVKNVVARVEQHFDDTVATLKDIVSISKHKECKEVMEMKGADVESFDDAMQTLLQFVNASDAQTVNSSAAALTASRGAFRAAVATVEKSAKEMQHAAESAVEARALIRSGARAAREAAVRAEDASRKARDASDRVAAGCRPLHKQLLALLRGTA
ncbi:hypothetical protein TRVL_07638 [Trypanosoma vivax]|nr:hypothetical protein TRVL_07638 [Trypanosoma vivax]